MKTIDTYQLDKMISADAMLPFGTDIDWHGHKGRLIRLTTGTPAIKVEVPCDLCHKQQVEIIVISGCHEGAFCYVVDHENHRSMIADLRNQSVACQDCAK